MIGIIIQARMGSTRFPGKVLEPISGTPLIFYITNSLARLKTQAKIIVATTNSHHDNIIERSCIEHSIGCFRGSESNVLKRFYLCAKKNNFSQIIRLTADNPLTDIDELDNLTNLHLKSHSDYSYSFNSLPKGVGAEIFTYGSLKESYLNGYKEHHLEHVNEYILENQKKFKIQSLYVEHNKNKPEISLTIDTPKDYHDICQILSKHDKKFITTEKAIQLCSQLA